MPLRTLRSNPGEILLRLRRLGLPVFNRLAGKPKRLKALTFSGQSSAECGWGTIGASVLTHVSFG
jgi:hypothetical protein